MNANTLLAALVTAASLGLVGCDVKKTQEGNVTVPKYEVTTPDVNVTKKETVVTVPKVVTEKETITVPSIDIKTGKEKAAEQGK
ncbi:MAG: hypothetical protein H7Y33_12440 [Cytophagales bacterium]|nr:hypothetical protein [Rhizobacter sp.]